MKLTSILFPFVLSALLISTLGCATAQPSQGMSMNDKPPAEFEPEGTAQDGKATKVARHQVPKSSQAPFFFIQMSDPQFGMFGAKKGRKATDFQKEINNFRMAIAEANRLKPRFVVITGDLIQNPGDKQQIDLFKRMLKEFDASIPVHLVAGNHDAGNKPTPASVRAYKRDFTPKDHYAFGVERTHFIVLNSCLIHRPGQVEELAQAQMTFLKKELAKAKAKGSLHTILFMHHPLFLKRPNEKDGYFVIPKVRRQPILDLLKRHNASAVFAGHWHGNSFGRDEHLQMVTTGPVGKPLHEAPSGFRIVTVTSGGVSHSYHGLGKIPYKVTIEP
jgi:3',5'-cyclic AMP phosphodiesterase CpdA